jgi:Pectate lyase superfamily protein
MLVLSILVATILCQLTGSNAGDVTESNNSLDPNSAVTADPSSASDFYVEDSSAKCKFNLRNSMGACLSPDLITVAPTPTKTPFPGTQTFPGRNVLTVVSATSAMQGDLKCTGSGDQVKIQEAIDNMNKTGGTVILSDGTFHIDNQIYLCNDLTLKGQGMNVTIIRYSMVTPELQTKLKCTQEQEQFVDLALKTLSTRTSLSTVTVSTTPVMPTSLALRHTVNSAGIVSLATMFWYTA